ncbi:MAG: G2/mitotic-specific cyclin [Peltula sp. TS41687]|nr:MAG: G2/mitotic-specific cyclin [Peltula sp. TS41687]
MPPARPARHRAVTNENDENGGTVRLTRAKAAALATDTTSTTSHIPAATKKSIQSKTAALNAVTGNTANLQRKRAALGDVSNVTKSEVVEAKEMKKALNAKVGLVSKASQTAGIQKGARTGTARPVLGAKETNRKTTAAELKRPASGSGVMGGIPKKRNTSMSSHKTVKEEVSVREEVESQNKKTFTVEVEKRQQVMVEEEEEVEAKPTMVNESKEEAATRPEIRDLDMDDLEDPLMAAEYVGDIFEYLRELEMKTMPNPDYMDHQEDLEWKMRGILVDWLIEVHTRFHLLPETLFLAVNIVDRFLSAKIVQLDRLQLVGVTAMFIASKYEEVLSPHVANFRHVADDGFTEQEILSAERLVLSALDYNLSYPNPLNFLRRISKADNYDIQSRTLGKYLMEISLVDDRFLCYPPSLIAAGAMHLARVILRRDKWDATLEFYSGYTEEEIEPISKLMIDYLARPVQHEALFKKYASKKFLKASILTRQWAKKFCAIDLTQSPGSSR